GKSPCYVDNSVTDMKLAAKRIMWGKMANAGQTCIAPDYILCHEDVYESFLKHAKKCLEDFYEGNPRTSTSFGRIVSSAHAERLQSILSEKNGRIICGGGASPQDRYVDPTIIADVTHDSKVMEEEIFGPIMPVMKVKNHEQAIDIMQKHEKPLALYLFGKNRQVFDRITSQVTSGGVCVNDTLMHVVGYLPFGGVGSSGVGSYHGKFSFDDFSHMRAVMRRDDHALLDAPQRYPPYSDGNMKFFLTAAKLPAIPAIHPTTFRVVALGSVIAMVAVACHRFGLFGA
ncbi:Aldh3b1, partial [Symbiodinium microadriaticum]